MRTRFAEICGEYGGGGLSILFSEEPSLQFNIKNTYNRLVVSILPFNPLEMLEFRLFGVISLDDRIGDFPQLRFAHS